MWEKKNKEVIEVKKFGMKVLTVFIAIVCVLQVVTISVAAGPTVTIDSLDVSPGAMFTIDITVDPQGEAIYGVQYDLYFDPAVLQVVSQTKGNFLTQDGASSIEIVNTFNNTLGKLEYGETRMGVENGVTGTGTLARVTFEAVGTGSIDLTLSNVLLSNPSAQPIAGVVLSDGVVNVVESQPSMIDLTPTALSIPDPIYLDHDYIVDATISNLESGDASSFNVTLKADGMIVDDKRVDSLAGDSDITVIFNWKPATIGTSTLLVEVDPDDEIAETDELNNTLSATVDVVEAAGPTVTVDSLDVSPGETFTIDITVDPQGEEIYGAQYDLYFDPAVLQVVSQTAGDFLTQDGASSIEVVNTINNTLGKLEYGETRMGVENGVTGTGVLATIEFEAVETGSTNLTLSNVLLSDPSAQPIAGVVLNNGVVNVVSGTPTPTPTPTGGAIVTIPDVAATGTLTAPIRIENVTDAGAIHLTLTYDPDVVIVSGACCNSDFDTLFANTEDAARGSITLIAYQTQNPGLNGDVLVADVTFMVVGSIGSSTPLNLTVTTLTDASPACNPIPYSVSNGSFTVFLNGDVNGDGRVDAADCMYLAKHLLGVSGFETIVEVAADVNGNGEIEASDCMYLAKHLAGIDGFEELK
ncbi:MAG: protein containing APHP [Candidatus Syntrophoarchaeum caldarius]|uniref:Protein containing APHP n=1 Tax=Candidatus Syntropharchaeum caldarium TaxID=1838285 RepID=A0A1F2PC91_9EURY|nr:MAG: protein containing APHP [Candidatus Syntrophoarchaeum caldarius]